MRPVRAAVRWRAAERAPCHFETGAAALREGGKGGRTKRALQALFQAFPNLRLFSPKKPLSESYRGIGLFSIAPQGFEGDRSPNGRVTLRGVSDAFMGTSDPDAENLQLSLN